MSYVSYSRIKKDTVEGFKEAIFESMDLANYSFAKDIENIVIKPNLCYYWDWTTGQTTDPKFIGALIELIRERISRKVDITVVESDASAMKTKHVFKMLAYDKLAHDYNVKLLNLSESAFNTNDVTVGKESFKIAVPEIIRNADLRINVPKIKYAMEPLKITCALKNIFGCIPYPRKFRYHSRIEEVIVAANKVMKSDLCIIDANIVSGAQPRRLGLVMASKDPVAIDTAACHVAGIKPRGVRYIRMAHGEGVGNLQILPKGCSPNYFRNRYPRRDIRKKILSEAYKLVTHIGLDKRLGLH